MSDPLIVARCGDSREYPENTLVAFESAIAKGADAIECDVHRTRDGEMVVHHDFYLGRTNEGSGTVSEASLTELRGLDAGRWFDERFAGERIPTLEEVLDLGKGKVRFELDMRTPGREFVDQLLGAVEGMKLLGDTEFTSVHMPLLYEVKKRLPSARIGVFFDAPPAWQELPLARQHVLGWMRLSRFDVAHLDCSLLDAEMVESLHAEGFRVHGANLNTRDEIASAHALRLDQFSTDDPGLAVRVRTERKESAG